MMKRIFTIVSGVVASATLAAQNRFPKPDFESGYEYPDLQYAVPNEIVWDVADIVMLVALLLSATWAVMKRRKPMIWISVVSVLYFGFLRNGCVCSVGSIQNVVLALVDGTYSLPWNVLALFLLPIVFAFLFGRVFCAGVCPIGALQELVNIKNGRISKPVTMVLGLFPWIYLILTILYAATRSRFLICQFDPFIGIFRLGGDVVLLAFGILLLVISVFTGRPFCRFLCPYGALLSLFSAVSVKKVELTKNKCINCELCHNSCPVDAIRAPYANTPQEERREGVKRLLGYMLLMPLLVVSGALMMRASAEGLSRAHKEVRLSDRVTAYEAQAAPEIIPLEVEAFYMKGRTMEELTATKDAIVADYRKYATWAGAMIGLVLAIALMRFSIKRRRETYEIDQSACVACGRCFEYCPQNRVATKQN